MQAARTRGEGATSTLPKAFAGPLPPSTELIGAPPRAPKRKHRIVLSDPETAVAYRRVCQRPPEPAVDRTLIIHREAEEIAEDRVHDAVNEWISGTRPGRVLAQGESLDVLRGLRSPRYLWIGLKWALYRDPDLPAPDLRTLSLGLDATGKWRSERDILCDTNLVSPLEALQVSKPAMGRRDEQETLRLNLYKAQITGVREVVVFIYIRQGLRGGYSIEENLTSGAATVYDKFGNRYRDLAVVDLQPPFRSGVTCVEVLRLKNNGHTWVATAALNECSGDIRAQLDRFKPAEPNQLIDDQEQQTRSLCILKSKQNLWVTVSWMPMGPAGEWLKMDIVLACMDSSGRVIKYIVVNNSAFSVGRCWTEGPFKHVEIDLQRLQIPNLHSVSVFALLDEKSRAYPMGMKDIWDFNVQLAHRETADDVQELCTYYLPQHLMAETCVEVVKLIKGPNGTWTTFEAIGDGSIGGLDLLKSALREGTWLAEEEPSPVAKVRRPISLHVSHMTSCCVGVGWTCGGGLAMDLDLVVLGLGADGWLPSPRDLVYSKNPWNKHKTVWMKKLSEDGAGDGDDEVVVLQLWDIRIAVKQMLFMVMTRDRTRSLSSLTDCYIRMWDPDSGKAKNIFRHNVDLEQCDDVRAIEFGTITRSEGPANTEWVFQPAARPAVAASYDQIVTKYTKRQLSRGMWHPLPDGISQMRVSLGWDHHTTVHGIVDLDLLAFGLGKNNVLLSEDYCISRLNLRSANGSIEHLGDSVDGSDQDDDETIAINVSDVPQECAQIVFAVVIHDAVKRKQIFNQVPAMYLRVYRGFKEFFRVNLDDRDVGRFNTLEVGGMVQNDGKWAFKAKQLGSKQGHSGLYAQYGGQRSDLTWNK
uniref:TerD domain-containing protein n=1 Tax=Eutreptiella gymnastica TaxID=73025 RepID=A0A7S1J0H6_9EUGL|mmetsp:Transcript_57879/g.103329  ORF Transcript_57879/g.103329 Transcript_57879/m.103329 type:complete len:867 (+) Transcript_57879:99-2699(+)